MKNLICSAIVALLVLTATLQGQATLKVQWEPNPAADEVTYYTLEVDGSAYTLTPSVDETCACIQQLVDFTLGTHTLSVTASNEWGTSDPLTLTFDLEETELLRGMNAGEPTLADSVRDIDAYLGTAGPTQSTASRR